MDTKEKCEARALAKRIIDSLGGTAKAAAFCETSESAVSQWRTNGIPDPRLMYIKLARPDLFQDPEPIQDHPPRTPPSRDKLMSVAVDPPVLHTRRAPSAANRK